MLGGLGFQSIVNTARRAMFVKGGPYDATRFGSRMTTTPGADINLAIAKAYADGAGTVELPAGNFQIETSILQKSGIRIKGQGIGATKLTAKTGLNAPVIKNATAVTSQSITGITRVSRTATATKNAHGYPTGQWVFISGADQQGYNGAHQIFNVTANTFDYYVEKTTVTPATGALLAHGVTDSKLSISDLEIIGNAANTVGDNYGIGYSGVENFNLSNVYAHDTYNTCVMLISGVNGSLVNVRGDGAIHASHNGFTLGSTNAGPGGGFSYVQSIELTNCSASLNGQDGFIFQAGRGVTLTNCVGRRNALCGFKPCQVSQISIQGCYAEKNTAHGIQLQASLGVSNITISGNTCRENGDSGIQLGNLDATNPCTKLTIANNICDRNGQVGASTQYGIAFECGVGTTIDQVYVGGNVLTDQVRGLSFGTNGTVSNVTLGPNFTKGNTADIVNGASLQTSTLITSGFQGPALTASGAGYPMEVHHYHFWTDNLPQASGTVTLSDGISGRGYMMPRAGFVRSVSVKANANVTAGNATFQARLNGVIIAGGFNAVLNAGTPNFKVSEQAFYTQAVAAGDMLTVTCVGDGALLPNGTDDFDVVVEVVY